MAQVTLSGKLSDVTGQPVGDVSNVSVKASNAIPTSAGITTSRPRDIAVNSSGEFNITLETGVKAWIFAEGDGWSDSVPVIAAEGMTELWQAIVNAVPATMTGELLHGITDALDTLRYEVIPLSEQVATDASATAANREHVDGQVAAIDTAFTESVPPYLQEDSPGGLRDTYVSVSEAPLNVERYGGDLQVTLDAAGTAISDLGGEVYVPAGTYTGSFNVPANVKLSGAGQRATRIRGVGADPVLTVGKGNHVSDMYVLGDRTVGGVGVAFRPAETHVTLRNLSVNGHDTGILLNGSWVCQVEQTTVQACGTGIRMRGTNNAVQVNGGEIQNCVDGVLQESGSSGWGVSFRTTIEGNSGQGVKFLGSSYGFSFTDCYFESNAEGHIGIHFLAEMLKITGCQFLNRAAFGIRLEGSIAHGVVVSDNLFNLNGEGDPRAIYVGPNGRDVYVARNYYLGLSKGKFDPAIDYEGIRLSWHQGNKMVMAPSTRTLSGGGASLNIPHGESPTNPNDGDVWTTPDGMFVRINGVTQKITLGAVS